MIGYINTQVFIRQAAQTLVAAHFRYVCHHIHVFLVSPGSLFLKFLSHFLPKLEHGAGEGPQRPLLGERQWK